MKAKLIKRIEGIIEKETFNSKLVKYAKALGRNFAKIQKIEYDDPEEIWLKKKCKELANDQATRLADFILGSVPKKEKEDYVCNRMWNACRQQLLDNLTEEK